ncbi:Glutathione-binding protein GsiB precursor (plasmid) [Roseovarius sp. THAF9]|nr:Glutathione-binding protein GsiB precursor [Roseovarius sp. THAF9]
MAGSLWSEAQAATPKKGGTLKAGADGGATTDTFNPLQMNGADHPTLSILSSYDTLTEIDETGAPQPSLAESWEGNADGTWAIKLRKGVEFHDGKTLTAEDVVWSLKRQLDENNRVAEAQQIVQNFEELRADGPDTVLIKQKEVNFDLPTHLSSFAMIIGKEGNDDWSAGIGTGPYVKEDWQPGIQYLGRKFANFYRDDQGHFDEVEILNITDPGARLSGLLSKTLHAIGSPETKTAGRLAEAPGFELVQVSATQHYTADMRADMDPFTSEHLRRAVKWGINRQEIVDKVLNGYGTIGNDLPISRGQQFYNDQLEQREYDPDKARYHLKQAGFDTIDLTLAASDGAFGGAVDAAVLMRNSMAGVGMNVTVDRRPADGYWSDVWLKAPWCMVYWNGRPTVDWMLSSTYTSGSDWNSSAFRNETFDNLLVEARAEPDEAKRREMYHAAQRIFWEESGTAVFAFANILIGHSEALGHGPVGVSRRMDDSRLPRRWWFA